MKNCCKGCAWYKNKWCNKLDCTPDIYDPDCNYDR